MRFWILARLAFCCAAPAMGVGIFSAPRSAFGEQAAVDDPFFAERLQPFLAKYCTRCHGGAEPKADLALDTYRDTAALRDDRDRFGTVVEYLEAGIMPPPEEPQPTAEEIAHVTVWVSQQVARLGASGLRDPGRVTIRRLNRAEYNNTIRDLFGINANPAEDFPSDDVGYGFDNIGDVLSLPPVLMEKYLAAAERIAAQAIVLDWPPQLVTRRFEDRQLSSTLRSKDAPPGRLTKEGEAFVDFEFVADAEYIVRARAHGEQAGPEPARMALRADGDDVRTFDVNAVADSPEIYEARVKLKAGKKRVAAAFLNNYRDPENPDPAQRDRNLIVDYLEVEGPFIEDGQRPEIHRRVIFREPSGGDEDQCARAIVARFATRAYRRPATAEEIDRLVGLARLARENGDSFEMGVRLAVQAVLVSPNFLFRVELDADTASDVAAQPIDDFQLASRLSYFLWSSMPDDELFRLAEQRELSKPENLAAQVQRMLADPRSRALVENFAGQWLQLRNLELAAPDRQRFKGFDDLLRSAMRQETELFFASILREDRSVLDLLDADYTFLNETLAKHYGIEGISGAEFRRVPLADRRRGGVLTQGSILTITSNPTRTSPVKRGKWVMEQILGTPPPPPPANVPELEQVKLEGTLRQKMEQHRENASCAVCHARMDPLGFALENFDAVGAWRNKEDEREIDASGVLPGGQTFAGAAELRAILKSRPESFARSLARKMLTYALGRGLEAYDTQAVYEIAERMRAADYKFSSLVLEVVRSEPFRMRRARGAE